MVTVQQYLEMKQRTEKATCKAEGDQECKHVFRDTDFCVYCGWRPPKKKRIRQSSKPLLNNLETECLEHIKASVPMAVIYKQAIRFRLGNGIWYKPDLVVFGVTGSRPKVVECKGPHAYRGGLENLKVAAGLYEEFRFFLAWKENGIWQEQEVLP